MTSRACPAEYISAVLLPTSSPGVYEWKIALMLNETRGHLYGLSHTDSGEWQIKGPTYSNVANARKACLMTYIGTPPLLPSFRAGAWFSRACLESIGILPADVTYLGFAELLSGCLGELPEDTSPASQVYASRAWFLKAVGLLIKSASVRCSDIGSLARELEVMALEGAMSMEAGRGYIVRTSRFFST
ncbi:hypothetical protein BC834DRAFT_474348 [Gloeopeniophorella convolvens]|nr:hypothetical protein BC834DRAFT_474348 [Gloeopeniophorella convolvens]